MVERLLQLRDICRLQSPVLLLQDAGDGCIARGHVLCAHRISKVREKIVAVLA